MDSSQRKLKRGPHLFLGTYIVSGGCQYRSAVGRGGLGISDGRPGAPGDLVLGFRRDPSRSLCAITDRCGDWVGPLKGSI